MAKGQSLLLGYQVTMSGETVWQGLAAILPIFHWTVLTLARPGGVEYRVVARGRHGNRPARQIRAAQEELLVDEYVTMAQAIKLYVDQHGGPDLGLSRPVEEIRTELAGIVDGMINPQAMFDWLDDDAHFVRIAGDRRFQAAMSDQGLALTVGTFRGVPHVNISTISESEEPI